jgi:uncharacterized protein YigE (DUF2233 family)
LTAARCDPKINHIRVVSTLREIGASNAYAAFSISDVARATHALLVVNAGSTGSFSLPVPVGLLITDGKTINQMNRSTKDGGVFCVSGDQLAIAPVLKMDARKCAQAVQRGPLLSSASSTGGTNERHRRTAVALDDKGRLVIVVTHDKTTLSALATFLYTSELVMKVQSALNLDGDASSGLLLDDPSNGKRISIGNVDGLVASAIAVTGRKP